VSLADRPNQTKITNRCAGGSLATFKHQLHEAAVKALAEVRRYWESYRRRFVSTRLAATLLADGAPCFAICACPALVVKRDCSYISIHFSLEIAEISLPIASSGKSSGDSK
jgi:hypothetical protein